MDALFFRLSLAFEVAFFRDVGLACVFFAFFAFTVLCVALLFAVEVGRFDFFCLLLLFFLLAIAAVYHRLNTPENPGNLAYYLGNTPGGRLWGEKRNCSRRARVLPFARF